MMVQTYIDIMLQSLEKKEVILDNIIELNKEQRNALENPNLTPDEFDEIVEAKGQLIEQLNLLDSGFEKLFDRTKEELNGHKDEHAEKIRLMQGHIKSITDKSVEIQAQESRNKDLMTKKFMMIKEQARAFRTSGRVANQYKQNMDKLNFIDPQFMDNKN
ncbi:MAG: flagellar export chaperone FlgN [Agathobacter sp.]|nr:flagellar export chaperone FlgN [Agathobacter sp.]